MELLEKHLAVMNQVFRMTERREIKGEAPTNEEKIFSIYEAHTDIIVKGKKDAEFGHKINLSTGKSNLASELRDSQRQSGRQHALSTDAESSDCQLWSYAA